MLADDLITYVGICSDYRAVGSIGHRGGKSKVSHRRGSIGNTQIFRNSRLALSSVTGD
jgi:hypothetical protein